MTTAIVLQEVETGEREKRLLHVYKKAFPAVANYVRKMGGDLDDARDIFHDAMVVYYEKMVDGKTDIRNESAYLLGTARRLWNRKFNSDIKNLPLDAGHGEWANDPGAVKPAADKLLQALLVAGEKCMELLRAFYYDKTPLADLAERFGYAGKRSVTVQKYKCIEKVREKLKEKAIRHEDFFE